MADDPRMANEYGPLALLRHLITKRPVPPLTPEQAASYNRPPGIAGMKDIMRLDQEYGQVQQNYQARQAQEIEDYMRANQQPASPAQPLPTEGVPLPRPRPRYGSYPPVILGVRG